MRELGSANTSRSAGLFAFGRGGARVRPRAGFGYARGMTNDNATECVHCGGSGWESDSAKAQRRERIATAVLQGLMACPTDYPYPLAVRQAVILADALIDALDAPKPTT